MTNKSFKKFTKNEIAKASEKSILDVADSLGLSYSRLGKDYCLEGNNAFRLYEKTNSFNVFNQNIGGNVIDFVMYQQEVNFPNAVSYLLTGEFKTVEVEQVVNEPKEPFKYDIQHSSSFDKAYQYLVNQRGLNAALIEKLHHMRFINQDTRGNIVFPWVKNGEVVGATKQGTYYNPENYARGYYKGIEANSESNFGFNISIGKPDKLYFFESPIDLLSYLSLNMDSKNAMLVSMDGLKEGTVDNFLSYFTIGKKNTIKEVNYCMDNDAAGQRLYDQLENYNSFNISDGSGNFLKMQFDVNCKIPENEAIHEAIFDIYKQAIRNQKSEVSPFLLASIHKYETNISSNNEYANAHRFGLFFANAKDRNDEKYQKYTTGQMTERVEQLIQKVEVNKIDYSEFGVELAQPYDLKKLFQTEIKNQNLNISEESVNHAVQRIEGLVDKFENNHLISNQINKDWNDVLLVQNEYNRKTLIASQQMGLEASNEQGAEKIAKNFGRQALDREDARKYNIKLK